MDYKKYESSKYAKELEQLTEVAQKMRTGENAQDVTLAEVIGAQHEGVGMAELYEDMGIDPNFDTISNMVTVPDNAPKFIVPEIYRDAIRLGLKKAPIYPNITSAEQTIKGTQAYSPYINMSDAAPRYVGEGETISFGQISYGSKSFKIRKMGRGIQITQEVKDYVSINVVGIFLQDFGVKLGYALDTLAIDCLLNGEQPDGSNSAPVIGVETIGTVTYRDLLKIWLRLARLGRKAQTMIAGETMALDVLDLPEFKMRYQGTTEAKVNLKTPVPTSSDLYIHGSIPASQIIILDPAASMIKFNAKPLVLETERVASNQTEATYATLTSGFAILFQDSRLVLDSDEDFDTQGFPEYMNVDVLEVEEIK